MNICIIKYGALGDVVRTSFFAESLFKERNANIYWYTSEIAIPLLNLNPYIKKTSTNIEDFIDIEFDEIYNLEDELNFATLINSLNYKMKVGAFLENGNLNYTKECSDWFDMGIISRYGKIKADKLKKINGKSHSEIFSKIFKVDKACPKIYYKTTNYVNGNKSNNFKILVNPFAGNRWKSKELMEKELYLLINHLISESFNDFKIEIGLIGAGSDRDKNLEIKKKFAKKNISIEVYNTDNNLNNLISTIDNFCDLLITTDSLALHIANGLNKKIICFFSPTSAAEIDLFHGGEKIISTLNDYCNYSKNCDNSNITATKILNAVNNLILKNK